MYELCARQFCVLDIFACYFVLIEVRVFELPNNSTFDIKINFHV